MWAVGFDSPDKCVAQVDVPSALTRRGNANDSQVGGPSLLWTALGQCNPLV